VKNFAQSMELTQDIEDEQGLKRELASMGVEGIPGLDSTTRTPADD
jgi:DNA-directed RNA polymerase subunit B"